MASVISAADRKRRRKAYATIIRSLLTAIEAARELGNNILADAMSEQWRYANQQYDNLQTSSK